MNVFCVEQKLGGHAPHAYASIDPGVTQNRRVGGIQCLFQWGVWGLLTLAEIVMLNDNKCSPSKPKTRPYLPPVSASINPCVTLNRAKMNKHDAFFNGEGVWGALTSWKMIVLHDK